MGFLLSTQWLWMHAKQLGSAWSLTDLVKVLGGPAVGALKVRDHCRVNVATAHTHHEPARPEGGCRCAACWAPRSSRTVRPAAPGQVCS